MVQGMIAYRFMNAATLLWAVGDRASVGGQNLHRGYYMGPVWGRQFVCPGKFTLFVVLIEV